MKDDKGRNPLQIGSAFQREYGGYIDDIGETGRNPLQIGSAFQHLGVEKSKKDSKSQSPSDRVCLPTKGSVEKFLTVMSQSPSDRVCLPTGLRQDEAGQFMGASQSPSDRVCLPTSLKY